MNSAAVLAIYKNEMMRWWRTVFQSVIAPVITTALYFIVFGSAIGGRIREIDGVSYVDGGVHSPTNPVLTTSRC